MVKYGDAYISSTLPIVPPGPGLSPSSATTCVEVSGEAMPIEPIAIIGMSLKLPGDADNIESFWDTMIESRSTESSFPQHRLNHSAHYSSDPGAMGTVRPRQAHFLKEDLSLFDADFFGVTEAEARAMDPQQRGLLEVTYRALENAGVPVEKIYGTDTSVFTGCFTADYMMLMGKDPELMPKYAATGVAAAMLSNRISSFYNLSGPSATIDTACSSSLVALDQACQSLRLGHSSMGIVAGCNLIFSLDLTIGLSNMGFLSPDGVCHSFDQRANGYARGEGFGVVIVKRLSDALRDGDTIRTVIRATATNQDGKTALAQPSQAAQMRLIRSTYERAGLDPSQTKYVEAHGTGTPVGDPIEASAIGMAFAAGKPKSEAVFVSSLKANFGHLEGAAGIAALIKTVLVLERGIIPPVAGLDQVNRDIDIDFLNIEFPRQPAPWPSQGLRRASVNSFGFGGTNAHVIVDDAFHFMHEHGLKGKHCTLPCNSTRPVSATSSGELNGGIYDAASNQIPNPMVLVWSAKEQASLVEMVKRYTDWARNEQDLLTDGNACASLAYTLLERRSLHSWRSFALAQSPLDLGAMKVSTPISSCQPNELSLAFIFTGQGAQWYGMGKELLLYDRFRKSVLDAVTYLMSCGYACNFARALMGDPQAHELIDEPEFAQPLCTILQIALIELLAHINVRPSVVIGHSSGEIAAAVACGAISRESAWRLAYFRGICSSKLATMKHLRGGMIAVALSKDDATPYIQSINEEMGPGNLVIACINSPSNVTISGDKEHIQALASRLQQDSVFVRMLRVPVAYHGPHMEHVAFLYRKWIGTIDHGAESVRQHVNMVSSVTGERVDSEQLRDPDYWVKNMVGQVKFAPAVEVAFALPRATLANKLDLSHRKVIWATDILEIGPHSALAGPLRETLKSLPHGPSITYQSTLVRNEDARCAFLSAAGQLFCRGYAVHLAQLNMPGGNGTLDQLPALPNLPEYPFHHANKFWYESRVSWNARFRPHGRNPILGTPVADWNPLDARWRHFLKPADSPWIVDHKINDRVIFPAAGMLSMVIEAAFQLSEDMDVLAFEVSNATFHSALEVSTDNPDGVEVQTHLTSRSLASERHSRKYDWYLRTYQGGWSEVCHGTIRILTVNGSVNFVDNNTELSHLSTRAKQHFDSISPRCQQEMDGVALYERLRDCGYLFGPSFRRIQKSKHSASGEAIADVGLYGTPETVTATIVHPASLDGILQIMLPGITQGGKDSKFSTSIPTRINNIWISKQGLLRENAETVQVAAVIRKSGFRNTVSDVVALSSDRSLRVFVEGIETTTIGDGLDTLQQPQDLAPRLCWNIVKKPDLELLEPHHLYAILSENAPVRAPEQQYTRDLDRVLRRFLERASEQISEPPEGYLENHFHWIQRQLKKPDEAQPLDNKDAFKELYHRVRRQHPKFSKPYFRAGEHLVSVLRRQTEPLSLLFQDRDMFEFYHSLLQLANYMTPLHRYLDLLTHKNPSMSILEVGAGTGAATTHVMEALTRSGPSERTARYSRYCFTDISPSFFEEARRNLSGSPKIDFEVFNLEQDPFKQGFEPESFDIIVASLVLHATASLDRTLTYLRSLLKPGGKLVAIEVTAPDRLSAGFIFGLVPGWWVGKDSYRRDRLSPCLNAEEWNRALLSNGYSGLDNVFWDTEDEGSRLSSLWISTKVGSNPPRNNHINSAVLLVPSAEDGSHATICAERLSFLKIPYEKKCLAQLDGVEFAGVLFIIHDSGEAPLLQSLSSVEYEQLRMCLSQASNVLWMFPSRGSSSTPYHGAVHGLARTLQSENASLQFTIFGFDPLSQSTERLPNLDRIIKRCISGFDGLEPEIYEENRALLVPRVIEDTHLNGKIAQDNALAAPREVPFETSSLRLSIKTPGLLDSLYFMNADDLSSEPSQTEVDIIVKAVGVNFKDCLVALGRVADDTLGTECAGVVQRASPSSHVQPGDRVVVAALDTYRSIVRCNEALVAKIPDDLPLVEAAKISTNFITAYHALVEVGRITAGETILIHAGAGGTGQAAIQIAQHFGAEVFVTVGNEDKRNLVMTTYGIPDDHIFYSRDLSFAQGIKHQTGGQGVDLILNSLAGDQLRASWECIAPYGRFLEIGKRDIFAHGNLPMFQFARNVSFSAIDIAAIIKERPLVIQKSLNAVMELLAKKQIHTPSPLKVFSLRDVEAAFRYLQSGSNAGCVAVDAEVDPIVPALVRPSSSGCFKSNATYVVAGGFGGQGKSIIQWMGQKGAKSILVLSRKGQNSEGAKGFIESMRSSGVHVEAPPCDITDCAALRQTIRDAALLMPPIRGCIQAAMVIKDGIFSSMSYSDWMAAQRPKVAGSWNLHQELPAELDFFIMLSSTSGIIGSTGQANYASGNTFQDGLAAYRVSKGQNAVSLNLSVMKEDGYFVSNREALEQYLRIKRLVPMAQSELFPVLEHYCDPSLEVGGLEEAQVVMGLALPGDLVAMNVDLPSWMKRPLFSHLHPIPVVGAGSGISASKSSSDQFDLLAMISAGGPSPAEVGASVAVALREKLARVLSRAADEIDVQNHLQAYGVDSLVAVELRNWILKALGVDVPVFEILGGGSIAALGAAVAERLPR